MLSCGGGPTPAQYNYLTSNLYFAITCRCRTATLLYDFLVYYQATNNVIVLVIVAPASAPGARARHRCCTAIPLHDSLVYYQVTNNVIVFVVIAPASATGARARQ